MTVAVVRARGYWSPKLGHARHEWEDGLAYSERTGRLAVADGASSSFMAQGWARRLVAAFVAEPPRTLDHEAFDTWVRALLDDADVEGAAAEPDEATPWYVTEAAVRGAFATFLGVEVADHGSEVGWRCFAVGDSCLLHLRGGDLVRAFPVERAEAFGSTPDLVSSVAFADAHGAQHLQVTTGTAEPGDLLVLVTDGLAAWALERGRTDPVVWQALGELDGAHLAQVVDEARRTGEMVNDDVTLLRARVGADR